MNLGLQNKHTTFTPVTLFYFTLHVNIVTLVNVYSKTCLKRPLKKKTKIGFQDPLSLDTGQKYCRMLHKSILQYFRFSLNFHLTLKPLLCLFFSGSLRQVLLYVDLLVFAGIAGTS